MDVRKRRREQGKMLEGEKVEGDVACLLACSVFWLSFWAGWWLHGTSGISARGSSGWVFDCCLLTFHFRVKWFDIYINPDFRVRLFFPCCSVTLTFSLCRDRKWSRDSSGRRLEPSKWSNGRRSMVSGSAYSTVVKCLGLRLCSNFAAVNVSEFLVRLLYCGSS